MNLIIFDSRLESKHDMENLSSGAILILVFLFFFVSTGCFAKENNIFDYQVVVRFILLVVEKLLLKYLRKKFHCEFEFTYYNFTLLSTHVSGTGFAHRNLSLAS
jgi:hypothetical protein